LRFLQTSTVFTNLHAQHTTSTLSAAFPNRRHRELSGRMAANTDAGIRLAQNASKDDTQALCSERAGLYSLPLPGGRLRTAEQHCQTDGQTQSRRTCRNSKSKDTPQHPRISQRNTVPATYHGSSVTTPYRKRSVEKHASTRAPKPLLSNHQESKSHSNQTSQEITSTASGRRTGQPGARQLNMTVTNHYRAIQALTNTKI
jgi:hypothetical protein